MKQTMNILSEIRDCFRTGGDGGGGYSPKFFKGVCSPNLDIRALFQTKICNFPDPTSDLNEISIPHFRSLKLVHGSNIWPPLTRNSFHLRKDSRSATNLSMLTRKKKFLLHKIPTAKPHNHTLFQTKMVRIYTHFKTKTTQKPYPLGSHVPL